MLRNCLCFSEKQSPLRFKDPLFSCSRQDENQCEISLPTIKQADFSNGRRTPSTVFPSTKIFLFGNIVSLTLFRRVELDWIFIGLVNALKIFLSISVSSSNLISLTLLQSKCGSGVRNDIDHFNLDFSRSFSMNSASSFQLRRISSVFLA